MRSVGLHFLQLPNRDSLVTFDPIHEIFPDNLKNLIASKMVRIRKF